jgi:hypothetical protein
MVTAAGLARRLGTTDAVVIGLGSMIGAGVRRVRARRPRRRTVAARRPGRGRRRRLLQRHLLGSAGRPLPVLRRNLRLRLRTPRCVLGLPRRVGVRGRQDRLLRRDCTDIRRWCGRGQFDGAVVAREPKVGECLT